MCHLTEPYYSWDHEDLSRLRGQQPFLCALESVAVHCRLDNDSVQGWGPPGLELLWVTVPQCVSIVTKLSCIIITYAKTVHLSSFDSITPASKSNLFEPLKNSLGVKETQ